MSLLSGMASRSEGRSLWRSVIDAAKPRLTSSNLESLSRNSHCFGLTATTLRVGVDGQRLRTWVDEGWLSSLDLALDSVADGAYDLALIPIEENAELHSDPSYTLATFVTSPANRGARELAEKLATAGPPGAPVLIHGPSGSGKTHLLRAIARDFGRANPGAPVVLRGAEELSLELIDAIWNKDLDGFRLRLQHARALLIDDLQVLVGREATQEQLALTLAALHGSSAPVVLASSRPPARLSQLVAPLREQLARMRAVELAVPEWETRVAIILDRMRRWRSQASPEVTSFLAGRLRTGLDRLDTVLTRLMTHPACIKGLVDVDMVRHVLNDANRRELTVAPEEVISLVARHFNLRLRDLRSTSRSPRVTGPRQIAMYLVRRHCGLSYPEIGRRFGRHHTTALHSDRLVQRQLDQNGSLRAAVTLLEKDLLRAPGETADKDRE